MQTVRAMIAERRCGIAGLALRAVIVAGYALLVCGCNTDMQQVAAVPDVPTDYRLRHPITISEADHSIEIFIGSNRGALSATQRADVLAFAQTWRREATGGVVVDLPVGTSNARAAAEAMREIGSILTGPDPTRCATEGHRRAQLSPAGGQPRNDPHDISEDGRTSRTLWSVARGCRAKHEPRLLRESASMELWLRQPTQPRGDGR